MRSDHFRYSNGAIPSHAQVTGKKYYQLNRDRIFARRKEYARLHPEKKVDARIYQRNYHQANKENRAAKRMARRLGFRGNGTVIEFIKLWQAIKKERREIYGKQQTYRA